MSRRLLEAELRAPVRAYLEARGYRVWTDPDGRDYLDVVAARATEVGLVELKVADWKTVRAQAVARRALADWVAVALPSERLAERLVASLSGPVAPRIGVLVVAEGGVRELRAPRPLDPPAEGTDAAVLRGAFRDLVRAALAGEIPGGVRWSAPRGGGRRYRLDEFGDARTDPG